MAFSFAALLRPVLPAASALFLAGALAGPAQAGILSGALAPSQNFDLTQWKLTMPSGDEVSPAMLNSGFQYADVFYTDARIGGMVLRCPNIAGTTDNSHYSRTELREMLDPGNTSAKALSNNWTPEQGGWLRAKLRVDHVSKTGDSGKVGRVIVGQIHGPSTEPLRLYYAKKPTEATGRIYAAVESTFGSTWRSADIVSNANDAGIALGENFTYQIKLYGTQLSVAIYRRDGRKYALTRTIDANYLGQSLYFKAGVYNQNNTGDLSDYVQATFFILEHTH
ncbi:MAG: polysaccharide lyase family 7 protein [Sinimarinibacterium sp.]|jgi:poly(beta-D-mannuronate) lyase